MKNKNATPRRLCMVTPCVLLCLAAPTLAAGPPSTRAYAIDGHQPRLEPSRTGGIISKSHGINRRDGALTGDGPDYRAGFEPGRLTFTPALGSQAQQTLPVSFTLEEIRLGDELVLRADPTVEPVRRTESRIVYRRAGGIDERYDVRADGVHQTFLFPTRLEGSGDLVVRGRIATDLVAVPTKDGMLFERAGLGGVQWGAVTGIDAEGRSAAGQVRLAGDVLELVLPASFVARASYPLLLDPLIGSSFDVMNVGNDDNYPDVAYDATENVYLVVWQRTFSIWDMAVRGQRVTSTGAPTGGLIAISDPPNPAIGRLATTPSVANVNASDRFLVVWRERLGPLAKSDIVAAAVSADDGSLSSTLLLAPSLDHQTDPTVGGDRTLLDDDAVVVWSQQTVGIRMCQVTVPPAGDPYLPTGTATLEPNSGPIEQKHPAISRSAGDSQRFVVAWERMDTSTGIGRIVARIISSNAVALGQKVDVSSTISTVSDERPAVDGDGERWVIAWQRQEFFVPTKFDIMTRAGWRLNEVLTFDRNPSYLESDIDDDEHFASVAWTGDRAAVAYVDEFGTRSDVYVTSVDPYTGLLGEGPFYVSTAAGNVWRMGMASGWSGAATSPARDDAFLVFGHVPQGTASGDILGVRYDAPPEPVDLGGGTSQGGSNVNPMLHEGNANFRAQLRGATPNAPTFLVISRSMAPSVCGAGTFFPSFAPGRIFVARFTDANGNASAAAAIPPGTAGLQAYSQWATSLAGGACNTGNGFTFSNGLHLTIQP